MDSLNISRETVKALNSLGIKEATDIQKLVIPDAISGHNITAISQTGSGKTLTFLIPLIEYFLKDKNSQNPFIEFQALILCPTRELAQQVAAVYNNISTASDKSFPEAVLIYGGVEYAPQIEALKKENRLIISTPGRLLDLLTQNVFSFKALKYFVLDEVDQMLDLGFYESIIKLSKICCAQAQYICTSATLPDRAEKLLSEICPSIKISRLKNQKLVVENIRQSAFLVEKEMMDHLLIHLLRSEKPEHAIIFTRSRKMADRLTKVLIENTFSAEAMHSERSQTAREHILERFRAGQTRFIVATDLIARGIDINNISHIINYGLPQDPESYIHRIGRSARAGESGIAITLCTPDETIMLSNICKLIKQNIPLLSKHPYKIVKKKGKSTLKR